MHWHMTSLGRASECTARERFRKHVAMGSNNWECLTLLSTLNKQTFNTAMSAWYPALCISECEVGTVILDWAILAG